MLRITLKSHSTICIFTRSHKKTRVSYVTGTPKLSQIGSLIYGITLHWEVISIRFYFVWMTVDPSIGDPGAPWLWGVHQSVQGSHGAGSAQAAPGVPRGWHQGHGPQEGRSHHQAAQPRTRVSSRLVPFSLSCHMWTCFILGSIL